MNVQQIDAVARLPAGGTSRRGLMAALVSMFAAGQRAR
jgi:hypothetical protein